MMLYIAYGSVCELEAQILLVGDLSFIEKDELSTIKKDIEEIERMLRALMKLPAASCWVFWRRRIKSLENRRLNP